MGKRSVYTKEFLESVIGFKTGLLEVISVGVDSKGTNCEVKCQCGNLKIYRLAVLLRGKTKSCGCFISKGLPKIGDRFRNNKGNWAEVIDPVKWDNIIVKFDNTNTVKSFQSDNLKRGIFFDPFDKTYWDFGYLGEGIYSGKRDKDIFNTWMHMIERCYNVKSKPYKQYGGIGVTVCNEWANFQTFTEWFVKNKIQDYHLDKDLLYLGNKVYSPETCIFIPPSVNSLFTGSGDLKNMGVHPTKNKLKYSATVNNKDHGGYLGVFDTWVDAKKAYLDRKLIIVKKLTDTYELDERVVNNLIKLCSIEYYT